MPDTAAAPTHQPPKSSSSTTVGTSTATSTATVSPLPTISPTTSPVTAPTTTVEAPAPLQPPDATWGDGNTRVICDVNTTVMAATYVLDTSVIGRDPNGTAYAWLRFVNLWVSDKSYSTPHMPVTLNANQIGSYTAAMPGLASASADDPAVTDPVRTNAISDADMSHVGHYGSTRWYSATFDVKAMAVTLVIDGDAGPNNGETFTGACVLNDD